MNRKFKIMTSLLAIAVGATALVPVYSQNVSGDVLLPNPYPYIATTNTAYPEWFHSVFLAQRTTAINEFTNQLANPTIVTESMSPPFFFKRTAYNRYNLKNRLISKKGVSNPNIYIAHRGLVNLNAGVLENTFDSFVAARSAGIGMVEVDIQAGLDGLAYVTHDDSLYRTTGVDVNVNSASSVQLNSSDVYTPVPVSSTGRARRAAYGLSRADCDGVGERLMDLATLYDYLDQNSYNSSCGGKQEMMYFLDPKNLASGIAGMKFVAGKDSVGRSRFYMKTYDNYWAAGGVGAPALLKAGLGNVTNTNELIVMPVINVRTYLDNTALSEDLQYSQAVSYAVSILQAYSTQGFQIGSVEFPGAWDTKWQTFVTKFYDAIRDQPEVYYKNNPVAGFTVNGVTRYRKPMPVLAYGYRFPDFKINGVKYTWSMQGYAQIDTVNSARGTLGAQAAIAKSVCDKRLWFTDSTGSYYQTGCFVTHDFPHYENAAATNQTVSNWIGAPQTTLSAFPSP
jgi:hypothetical protein